MGCKAIAQEGAIAVPIIGNTWEFGTGWELSGTVYSADVVAKILYHLDLPFVTVTAVLKLGVV